MPGLPGTGQAEELSAGQVNKLVARLVEKLPAGWAGQLMIEQVCKLVTGRPGMPGMPGTGWTEELSAGPVGKLVAGQAV